MIMRVLCATIILLTIIFSSCKKDNCNCENEIITDTIICHDTIFYHDTIFDTITHWQTAIKVLFPDYYETLLLNEKKKLWYYKIYSLPCCGNDLWSGLGISAAILCGTDTVIDSMDCIGLSRMDLGINSQTDFSYYGNIRYKGDTCLISDITGSNYSFVNNMKQGRQYALHDFGNVTVDTIFNCKESGDVLHKHIKMYNELGAELEWVEDVGYISLFANVEYGKPTFTDSWTVLICYYENGKLVYKNSKETSFYVYMNE